MSTHSIASPIRIWSRKISANIVSVDGRNHAKIPDRDDLFPVYDYHWQVSVFDIDGDVYRVEAPENDGQSRLNRILREGENRGSEIERLRSELAASQKKVEELQRALDEAREYHSVETGLRTKTQSELDKGSLLDRRLDSTSSNYTYSTSTYSAESSPRPTSPVLSIFVPKRPLSLSTSPRNSMGNPVPPISMRVTGVHRYSVRPSNISTQGYRDDSPTSSRYSVSPASHMSTSLPTSSPLSSFMSNSPPSSPKFSPGCTFGAPSQAPSKSDSPLTNASPPPKIAPLRRASSLPPVSAEEVLTSSVPSSNNSSPASISELCAEVDGMDIETWTKAQCDEWLASKLYPSTKPSDKTSSGQQAIHCASLDGQIQVVDYLVTKGGVELSQKDLIGNTPLICASSKGRLNMVKWIIARGAEIDAKAPSGRTALHSAAAGGHANVCELLVRLGADPKQKEQFGKTPRELAEAYQHKRVVDFLKEAERRSLDS